MDCFKMCMLGSILLLGAFKSLKSQMDPEIYGGAPLRSLVAHLLWEQAVWGSNPSALTNFKRYRANFTASRNLALGSF